MGRVLRKDAQSIMSQTIQIASQAIIALMAIAEFALKIYKHKKSNRPSQR